ncbi:MAG: YggS family pyridoxal phosphate-dependent enzyme [Candidatus Omnitrophica bacterium]|nr:YggS family pyridoxal phosphate-dependent enzyme [Candidatus Omnitrophota bacterium]MCM8799432.1 YggS family pyridoxal phosphate-dependent enzyme [Candidatus Omnitrophota bacterium]
MGLIKENVKDLLMQLPKDVNLVCAVKSRRLKEILEAIEAGVKIIGENYIQEAEEHFKVIGNRVKWHLIGHLQLNKVKKAIRIFDMIETLDSLKLAEELNRRCKEMGKIISVLIEVNSAEEPQKFGILPKNLISFIKELSYLENIKVQGLMTMGPNLKDPERIRPYFKLTRELFESIKNLNLNNIEMKYLSMGMSDSYLVAISEGANIIRIGTKIFERR